MDFNTALIGLIGIVVGALGNHFLGPGIKWQIEKRKEKLEHRRKLVESWRQMLSDVAKQQDDLEGGIDDERAMHALERHQAYSSFVTHYDNYRNRFKWKFWAKEENFPPPSRTFVVGSTVPSRINYMSKQIGKIEKWWGLG
jgi:hypothetical protein